MKIMFEIGDKVFHTDDYGGELYAVKEVKTNILICESFFDRKAGTTTNIGIKSAIPHPHTLECAEVLR